MSKKTIPSKKPTFIQAINISNNWCQEWEDDLISDEVLSDRISALISSKTGLRGFFALTLSDPSCTLLDKLPQSILFMFVENGLPIVEIIFKNLVMSSAQIINHRREKNTDYEEKSEQISERCAFILQNLDTKLVTEEARRVVKNLDQMGNTFDNSAKYDEEQKKFILQKINDLATKKDHC